MGRVSWYPAFLGYFAEWQTSTCSSYKENQYKMIMFWYYTPSLLHSILPDLPDKCWRCSSDGRGTWFHLFWDGSGIQPFWNIVQHLVYSVSGIRIPLSPLAFLLNVPPCKLSCKTSRLLLHMLTAAKCLIAALWKQNSLPSLSDLHSRLKEIRTMEYLTALLNNKIYLFD